MPDVIIKDMEMPRNCFTCVFAKFYSDGQPYCGRHMREVKSGLKRPGWCPLRPAPDWISVEERPPETDEEGYSKYVLAAFHNFSGVDIAQYRKDGEGGAWYPGDDEDSYSKYGIFVRAWMPLPEAPGEDTDAIR